MFNNEDLFDHFHRARKTGVSGWGKPRFAPERHIQPRDTVTLLREPPADVVTETDIVDWVKEQDTRWLECDVCGHHDYAMNLVHQFNDEWMCWPCEREHIAEWEDQQRTMWDATSHQASHVTQTPMFLQD